MAKCSFFQYGRAVERFNLFRQAFRYFQTMPRYDDDDSAPKNTALIIGIVLAVVVAMGIAVAVLLGPRIYRHFHPPTIEEKLAIACADVNKKCPVMVDAGTRCDSTAMTPNRTWHYHFTLIKAQSGEYDATKIHDELQPKFVESYRSSPSMKGFREAGVTVIYEYYDASGGHITDIEVGPKDLAQ